MTIEPSVASPGLNNGNQNKMYYDLSVYPNPSTEYTSFEWNISEQLSDCTFKMYELSGKEIMQGAISVNRGEKLIDTRNLNRGIYLISIENKGEIKSTVKLIIEE